MMVDSSPVTRSRSRRTVVVSTRVAYVSHLPSGLRAGRIPLPNALVRVVMRPVLRSSTATCQPGNWRLYPQPPDFLVR